MWLSTLHLIFVKMSNQKNKFYVRLFHIFCLWLICNIKLENAMAELYRSTQAKYIKNNLQYFSRNHQFSLEKMPQTPFVNANNNTMDYQAVNDLNGDIKLKDNILNKLSWKCANSNSCLYNLLSGLLESYRRGDVIKLGLFDLIKLTQPYKSPKNTHKGRSMSTLLNFLNGYAIRVPIGPMLFNIQRSNDDADYIEIALLRKVTNAQARFGGEDGGGGEFRKRKQDDKKEIQMFIPFYLAATTFGWTLLALKTVSLMVLKALTLSKFALVVAAMILLKRMMDTTPEKPMYHYNEPPPYMMPYGLDYGMHSAMSAAPIEMAGPTGDDMYVGSLPYHAASAAISSPLISGSGALTHPGIEHFTGESEIFQTSIPNIQNDMQLLTPTNDGSLNEMVKRTGGHILPGRRNSLVRKARPIIYNYFNPYKQ